MTDPRLNRTGIDSILNRVKNPDEITAKMDRDRVRLARGWGGNTPYDPVDLVAALLDLVQRQDEELARVRQNSYAHMCRWDHVQIGHSESGNDERCPLCQKIDEADDLRAENDSLKAAEEVEPTDREWEQSACRWTEVDEPAWCWVKAVSAEAYRLAAERAKGKP